VWRWYCAAGTAPPSNHHPPQAPGLKQPPVHGDACMCNRLVRIPGQPDASHSTCAARLICDDLISANELGACTSHSHLHPHYNLCSLDSHERVHTPTCMPRPWWLCTQPLQLTAPPAGTTRRQQQCQCPASCVRHAIYVERETAVGDGPLADHTARGSCPRRRRSAAAPGEHDAGWDSCAVRGQAALVVPPVVRITAALRLVGTPVHNTLP
jgi:hypothetical protein